jgi:hypothetical protein
MLIFWHYCRLETGLLEKDENSFTLLVGPGRPFLKTPN